MSTLCPCRLRAPEFLSEQTSGDPIEINREIDEYIEQSKRAVALDENDGLRDLGSPEALRFIGEQMRQETAEFSALLKAQAHEALIDRATETANEAFARPTGPHRADRARAACCP